MRRFSLPLLVATAAACAAPGAARTEAPARALHAIETPSRARFSSAILRPTAAVRETTSPPIAPPASATCRIAASDWSGDLQLQPGGPVFGRITSGPAVLTLPLDSGDSSGIASVEDEGARLLGVVDRPELFAKRATTLSSFIVPHSHMPLSWEATGVEGHLLVSLDVSDAFETPQRAQDRLACNDVSITARTYEARLLLAPASAPKKTVSGGVGLMLAPAMPAVALLKPGAHDAFVIRTAGKHSQIVIDVGNYYAFGWVDSHALGPSADWGGLGGTGSGRGRSSVSSARTCAHDLEIFAEVAGQRASVGTLKAGYRFGSASAESEPGFTAIRLLASWFDTAGGAAIVVRTTDFAGC